MDALRGRPVFLDGRKPGVNVDHIGVDAGVNEAVEVGYDSPNDQMVVGYAMARWRRGEEEGALRTMMDHGIDLTSAYRIVAAARVAGEIEHTHEEFLKELDTRRA